MTFTQYLSGSDWQLFWLNSLFRTARALDVYGRFYNKADNVTLNISSCSKLTDIIYF